MTSPDFISVAVDACCKCREAERLFAQVGAYEQAAKVRDAREELEKCTIESIANLRPEAAGLYQPKTLGGRVDEKEDGQ